MTNEQQRRTDDYWQAYWGERFKSENQGYQHSITKLQQELEAERLLRQEAERALEAIESVVGDDACEIWALEDAHRRFRGRSRLMQEKLSAVYKMAHASMRSNSCYHVHDDWRALVEAQSRSGIETGE